MVESPDFLDPQLGIPVFSLYGEVRRPTAAMLDTFDVLLVDLQDLGCRIYTFITTLRYVLEAAAQHGKSVWVLDRPNPIGRPVEGTSLRAGWESFVGAGEMPMRHGLTLGEMGALVHPATRTRRRLPRDRDDRVAAGRGTGLRLAARRAHLGEPEPERAEPLDGALLPRHRDARRHDAVRRPRHDSAARVVRRTGARYPGAIVAEMQRLAPQWLAGCKLRPCWFEPTFHKHHGQLCAGLHVHVEDPVRMRTRPSGRGACRRSRSRRCVGSNRHYPLWRDFAYEYEHGRLAIDLINGSESLREWVDDAGGHARRPGSARVGRRSTHGSRRAPPCGFTVEPAPRSRCDVLVVGGGINGTGIARDAAGRGLRVVLCEQHDLASHTSSASTKLVHGGLRYLEHYDFGLVRKSLREREIVLASAPHLAWPLRFVLPHDDHLRPAWMIRAGLFLYDHLAQRRSLPASKTVDLRKHPAGATLESRYRTGFRLLRRLGRRCTARRRERDRRERARRRPC